MSFLDHINAANRCNPANFRPLRLDGRRLGFLRHDIAEVLREWPRVFVIDDDSVALAEPLATPGTPLVRRNAAVEQVVRELRQQGLTASHWWDEPYAVNAYFSQPPSLLIERGAIQAFGVCGYGVHINGYVRDRDGLKMWIGRRAHDKVTAPGKLDQMVAGGQPANIGLKANVIKECAEEAAIPAEWAERALPVGVVSYCLETEYGLRPDVVYTFDLELPPDFTPVNTDGEVAEFYLWPIEQVLQVVRDTTEFKFNCALVIIDFLIRHGVIDPEEPDYLPLVSGLRQRELVLQQFAE